MDRKIVSHPSKSIDRDGSDVGLIRLDLACAVVGSGRISKCSVSSVAQTGQVAESYHIPEPALVRSFWDCNGPRPQASQGRTIR